MIKEVTAVGKDILEAKENARVALGAGELDDVQFEIIDAGSKGIFGIIGVRSAKVRAFIELPDVHEKRQRSEKPKKEKAQPQQDTTRKTPRFKLSVASALANFLMTGATALLNIAGETA